MATNLSLVFCDSPRSLRANNTQPAGVPLAMWNNVMRLRKRMHSCDQCLKPTTIKTPIADQVHFVITNHLPRNNSQNLGAATQARTITMDTQRGKKRPRLLGAFSGAYGSEEASLKKSKGRINEQNGDDPEETLWANQSLFAIEIPASGAITLQDDTNTWSSFNDIINQPFDPSSWIESVPGFPSNNQNPSDFDTSGCDWLSQVLFPEVPSLEDRLVDLSLENPYEDNAPSRHTTLRPQVLEPDDGAVNGYIKFRIHNVDLAEPGTQHVQSSFGASTLGVHHRATSQAINPLLASIPNLPPNFGRGVKLDTVDNRLLRFYLVAYCNGRTLLPKTNFWITEIAAMIATEDATKHAMLALAGSYVLDYVQKDDLRERTNRHYRIASKLISEALRSPQSHEISKADGIVSAILLLLVDDCITWELRRPKGERPNWHRAAHLAKRILDHSDPGYRYWKTKNVQCDKSRLANANWTALACILAQPVTPLQINEEDRNFGWLLEGTEREVRTIHGGTGLSPKLLHIYAQITYLSVRMSQNPRSIVSPIGALKIEETLNNFQQRSELSEGFPTAKDLFDSCELDAHGKVDNATKVTELTGEAWVCAAKIYLHCRFFRKPRSHPDVRMALHTLIQCIKYMPYNGALFTSQSPFFCIFLMALVSYTKEDRDEATEWFETVLSGASCRSSVPPVWKAIQTMWSWMDVELEDESDFDENQAVGERRPWWEDMVAHLVNTVGWVSLT